jgi:single-strand DNA-binding protein
LPFTASGCLALRINQQWPQRSDQETEQRMNATQITTARNLTTGPDLRFTPSGKAVATVLIAVNHRVRRGEGWVEGEPTFYDVTLWEKSAEHAAESLRKGDRVLVTGQVHVEAWTDIEGAKRTRQVITEAEIGASLRFTAVEVVHGGCDPAPTG